MSNESQLGPLATYIGTWSGSGVDTVPDKQGGSIKTPFVQQITLDPIAKLGYGSQVVTALAYHCLDWAIDSSADPETMFPVFEERGYWIWIEEEQRIIIQVSNPRGLSMLAVGSADSQGGFKASGNMGDENAGVLVSKYLTTVEKPVGYEVAVTLLSPTEFHYSCNTLLELDDGSIFDQTDITTLQKY